MKSVDYSEMSADLMNKIKKGAFLTVKAGEKLNTMTIGWAMIGFVWRKPVMMVAVRFTRHTYGIMEKADDFTVTVPLEDMLKETTFCGTKSGRDVDKFKECHLATSDSRHVISPIIKAKGRHYECKIVYKSALDPANLDEDYKTAVYPAKDYHTLYFGEILACYETD